MSQIGDAEDGQVPPIASKRPPVAARNTPHVCIVAARASNGVIGAAGKLPWHLPEDLKHFKALTMSHPVVMGRRTWESIGRALPGRTNVVVTRQPDYSASGAQIAGSLTEALSLCASTDTAFVIGGAELYAEALQIAKTMVLTEIHAAFEGDTRFPAFRDDAWSVRSRKHYRAANGLEYEIVKYERTAH